MPNLEPAEEGMPSRIQKTAAFFEALERNDSPAAREGLPPTYRMRADAHYVDLLASKSSGREQSVAIADIEPPRTADASTITPLTESIRRFGVLQPLLLQERGATFRVIAGHKRLAAAVAAGLREVPCLVHHVGDDEATRIAEAVSVQAITPVTPSPSEDRAEPAMHAGADLARSLATLTACTELLAGADSELSRAVAGNLIRAELWRASCLLQATRVVRQEVSYAKSAVSVVAIVNHAVQKFSAEGRLRSVEFVAKPEIQRDTFIAGDERLLIGAVSSAVLATLAVVDGTTPVTLTISVAVEPANHVTFAVAQTSIAVSQVWADRAFDTQWVDRPGGMPAVVSMSAVQRVAEAHRGQVAVTATKRGTRIAITLPLSN
jgi:hypothetical protein